MLLRSAALAAAVALTIFVQGCAADAPAEEGPHSGKNADGTADPYDTPTNVELTKGSVTADKTFSDSVTVTPDSLVVPTAMNQGILAKVVIGSIIAGDRNSQVVGGAAADDIATSNPLGFLRRVLAIRVEGENTVLSTEKAELADWVDEGDLLFDGTQTSLFAGGAGINVGGMPTINQKSIKVQSNGDKSSTGSATAPINNVINGDEITVDDVKVKPYFKLSNASFKLNASFDGYFKVRKRAIVIPTGVKFRSHLVVDPTVSADIEAGIMLGAGGVLGPKPGKTGVGTTLGVPLWSTKIDGPPVIIPIAGPIPLTLQFKPRLVCSVSATGTLLAKVHAQFDAHAALGFEGKAGASGFDWKDLSEAPSLKPSLKLLGVQGKATMTAECEILAVPVLSAFDSVNLEGEIGPYVQLNATYCETFTVGSGEGVTTGFSIYEQHGLAGEFKGRVQVPFLHKGKDFDLLSVRALKSDPNFLVGDAKSCEIKSPDSCAGRKDGFYCSEIHAWAGFYCDNEQIAIGHQCDESQQCTGGNRDDITCK